MMFWKKYEACKNDRSARIGWMVRKGFVDFLDEMIKRKYPVCSFSLLNRGVPGDTAEGGLYRLSEDVLDHEPDCVLVQFALNDAFTGINVERFGNSVQSIINSINENGGAEVILVTSVCLGNTRENEIAFPFYKKLEELADSNEITVAKVHEYWSRKIAEDGLEFRKLVQSDLVHPTVEGYRLMAEAIMGVF
jgi:lysophospholipase L1-like esterase